MKTRKVVINACYGGFGLSTAAVKRLAELQGRPCYFFKREGFDGPYVPIKNGERLALGIFWAFDVENPNEVLKESKTGWSKLTQKQRDEQNALFSKHRIETRDVGRDDENLVRVVEELGDRANGEYATLRVIEIPADVEWEIDEYDGNEQVAEKHRTWGYIG